MPIILEGQGAMDFMATVQVSGEAPSLVLPLLGYSIWYKSDISLCSTAEGDNTYFEGAMRCK